MGKYEVTQREYVDVVGTNPSTITGDLNHPVENLSWYEATNYCAQLTQRELTAGRIPVGSRFRLPTEAEWEYAARAWTSTPYHYGDDPGAAVTATYAWIGDNSGLSSHPVGLKLPNPWGLHDMTGNVWEWCQDWYGSYPGGYQTDPTGPAKSTGTGLGSYKVMRGGGFDYFAQDCRSSRRLIFAPNLTDYDLGFRVVLAVSPQ
jgi:formylglycine-generating enzyme required for sulfatase activity